MTLIVKFVTADAAVLDTVAKKQTALVPEDLRANGFAKLRAGEIVVSRFDTKLSKQISKLLSEIAWEAAEGVMLLTDDSLPGLVDALGDQFCIHRFTPPAYGKPIANQLTSTLSKCLRAFGFLKTRFDDAKYRQIFRLPLRNFDAPEIATMRDLCRDMTARNSYGRDIDALLGKMRGRQKPKRASDYSNMYFVDDDLKHFEWGPEHHAQAETAIPPHDLMCAISNRLRFGHKFDGTTHYNVSREKGSIRGDYLDCHGAERPHGKNSHINMFTNDYF